MFCKHMSLHAFVHPRLCVSALSSVSNDRFSVFHQTFVIGASWEKDELIRFWVKRSRSHFCGRGIQHLTLPLSEAF